MRLVPERFRRLLLFGRNRKALQAHSRGGCSVCRMYNLGYKFEMVRKVQ